MVEIININTTKRTQLIDITSQVSETVRKSNIKDGVCVVYVPHTTAAVTINENADPNVREDIINIIDHIVPWQYDYKHLEGNSPAHIKATLIGPSVTIFIENTHLSLGTWQGVFFCEFDGPRSRRVLVKAF
ncbi:MAG: hypothetical protein AMJ45_01945 [Syntrophobacter sp. DG_60]|nr:MAG: hypothetical protein AMJ45_01945 [Syntrophobacter sp. DG_60]